MRFDVIPPGPEWDAITDQFPRLDVNYLSAYAKVHATEDNAPLLACGKDHDGIIIRPVLLRRIERGGACDVGGIYGYGGAQTNAKASLQSRAGNFALAYMGWARTVGIVSDFCAIHPMLGRDDWALESAVRFGAATKREHVEKEVVAVNVATTRRGMLDQMRQTKRHSVLKAISSRRVSVTEIAKTPDAIAKFWDLYTRTMDRRGAAPRWRFPVEYFGRYAEHMPQDTHLFAATIDGAFESAALVVGRFGTDIAYYQFAGSAMNHPKLGANDAMVFSIMEWAASNGFTWLHLGGGVSRRDDDPLLIFKAGFGPHRFHLKTVFSVFDVIRYEKLCDRTLKRIGEPAFKSTAYVPAYRREIA